MCDFKRTKIFWYELLPYVDVERCGRDIINKTGVLYDFFRESMAQCCGSMKAIDYNYRNERMMNQQNVLNAVHRTSGSVAMPISLDAEFPYTPHEFVPILATDGLFWVKVKEPQHNTKALEGISTTALPLLLVVITVTGYAALILWLLELRTKKNKQFSRSFVRGLFEAYWCTFISAATIGYGDKVAQTYAGKVFTIIWITFGICLMSVFTAIITTVMASIMAPPDSGGKPFYDEFIGVLEGSLDYLVLVKKSANSQPYPDTASLTEALNNGSVFNIVMDKHAYWIYRAKIHQNQSFEFRPGVQNPTSIGYIYNTNNVTLLRCLKDYAMQHQTKVTAHLEELVFEAVNLQPPDYTDDEVSLFFGPNTYNLLGTALGILISICIVGGAIDWLVAFIKARRKHRDDKAEKVASDIDHHMDDHGSQHPENGNGIYETPPSDDHSDSDSMCD